MKTTAEIPRITDRVITLINAGNTKAAIEFILTANIKDLNCEIPLRNSPELYQTVMNAAASTGRVEVVKVLLAKGVSCGALTKGTEKGVTPIYTAAKRNHSEVVKVMLKAGVYFSKDGKPCPEDELYHEELNFEINLLIAEHRRLLKHHIEFVTKFISETLAGIIEPPKIVDLPSGFSIFILTPSPQFVPIVKYIVLNSNFPYLALDYVNPVNSIVLPAGNEEAINAMLKQIAGVVNFIKFAEKITNGKLIATKWNLYIELHRPPDEICIYQGCDTLTQLILHELAARWGIRIEFDDVSSVRFPLRILVNFPKRTAEEVTLTKEHFTAAQRFAGLAQQYELVPRCVKQGGGFTFANPMLAFEFKKLFYEVYPVELPADYSPLFTFVQHITTEQWLKLMSRMNERKTLQSWLDAAKIMDGSYDEESEREVGNQLLLGREVDPRSWPNSFFASLPIRVRSAVMLTGNSEADGSIEEIVRHIVRGEIPLAMTAMQRVRDPLLLDREVKEGPYQGLTVLYAAAYDNQLDLIKVLFDMLLMPQCGPLSKGKLQGDAPLYAAARNGHQLVVEFLLAKGVHLAKGQKSHVIYPCFDRPHQIRQNLREYISQKDLEHVDLLRSQTLELSKKYGKIIKLDSISHFNGYLVLLFSTRNLYMALLLTKFSEEGIRYTNVFIPNQPDRKLAAIPTVLLPNLLQALAFLDSSLRKLEKIDLLSGGTLPLKKWEFCATDESNSLSQVTLPEVGYFLLACQQLIAGFDLNFVYDRNQGCIIVSEDALHQSQEIADIALEQVRINRNRFLAFYQFVTKCNISIECGAHSERPLTLRFLSIAHFKKFAAMIPNAEQYQMDTQSLTASTTYSAVVEVDESIWHQLSEQVVTPDQALQVFKANFKTLLPEDKFTQNEGTVTISEIRSPSYAALKHCLLIKKEIFQFQDESRSLTFKTVVLAEVASELEDAGQSATAAYEKIHRCSRVLKNIATVEYGTDGIDCRFATNSEQKTQLHKLIPEAEFMSDDGNSCLRYSTILGYGMSRIENCEAIFAKTQVAKMPRVRGSQAVEAKSSEGRQKAAVQPKTGAASQMKKAQNNPAGTQPQQRAQALPPARLRPDELAIGRLGAESEDNYKRQSPPDISPADKPIATEKLPDPADRWEGCIQVQMMLLEGLKIWFDHLEAFSKKEAHFNWIFYDAITCYVLTIYNAIWEHSKLPGKKEVYTQDDTEAEIMRNDVAHHFPEATHLKKHLQWMQESHLNRRLKGEPVSKKIKKVKLSDHKLILFSQKLTLNADEKFTHCFVRLDKYLLHLKQKTDSRQQLLELIGAVHRVDHKVPTITNRLIVHEITALKSCLRQIGELAPLIKNSENEALVAYTKDPIFQRFLRTDREFRNTVSHEASEDKDEGFSPVTAKEVLETAEHAVHVWKKVAEKVLSDPEKVQNNNSKTCQ